MEWLQIHKMLRLLLCLFFFFLLQSPSSSFTPTDKYFINCGSPNSSSSLPGDDRPFDGDSNVLTDTSSISLVDPGSPPDSSSPYHTARVFTRSPSSSSYEFELQDNGTHVVRLHFFPFSSQRYNLSSAVFDVSVSGFQLLSSFSVQNTESTPKEYFLKAGGKKLVISFTPSSKSPSAFAFVNAIEVFSAPGDLIPYKANYLSGESKDYDGLLETVHRINVGGPKVIPSNDTLWRTWIPDDDGGYLSLASATKLAPTWSGKIKYEETSVSPEIAPPTVYGTARLWNNDSTSMSQIFNMTWLFRVNSGYKHLVRVHFCDIYSSASNQAYQLLFNVYIGSYLAIQNLDLSKVMYQHLAAPYYQDFIVDPDDSKQIKVSITPTEPTKNAILNGVEIMKVYASRVPVSHSNSKKHAIIIGSILGGGFGLICLIVVACLLAFKCMRRTKPKPKARDSVIWSSLPVYGESTYSKTTTERTKASLSPHMNLGLIMPFAEIQSATDNFAINSLIGSGGFGDVYKGVLRDGSEIAVKRGKTGSSQGLHEFLAEITVLSKIHHRHLVSLIGYCEEQSEMILVYEFMENGSLKNHLYGSDLPCLSWKQRLEICIGAARGIHYLHTFSMQGIIHRDVKSANILLDDNYSAKVADFGLSRAVPSPDQSQVSTNVKGTFGYLDPEYFKRHHLTQKSDVYSFGVVLLEVLCARSAIDLSLPREEVNLAEWALQWQKKGLIIQIIDPRLAGTINPNSLRKFGEIAERCLAEYGDDRPTMGDVLWNLEYALQLQVTAMDREPHEDSTVSAFVPPLPTVRRLPSASTTTGSDYLATEVSSDATSCAIFSQLISSEGR